MSLDDLRALYQTAKWRRVRRAFLRLNPICAWPGCAAHATVVDHIVPRSTASNRAELARLTWDPKNFQPFCKSHHDEKTQREQGRGRASRRNPELSFSSSAVVTRDYSRGLA